MSLICTNHTKLYFGKQYYKKLGIFIKENIDITFILVDRHTKRYCLPYLLERLPNLYQAKIIEIPFGESQKEIKNCIFIWNFLSQCHASTKSLLINLGGGVLMDMGGFSASVYKRGISFINIPTTLLAMVDASVGGKTAVNFKHLKNQIGTFSHPCYVLIDTFYLGTLAQRECLSALAEIIKIALVCNKDLFYKIKALDGLPIKWDDLIFEAVCLKNKIVEEDPFDKKKRKWLNFGHSIGHSLEGFFLKDKNPLLHGEAIAIGMLYESWLSLKYNNLSFIEYKEIIELIYRFYKDKIRKIPIEKTQEILTYLIHDKKNEQEMFNFSLLKKIGEGTYDCFLFEEKIKDMFSNDSFLEDPLNT